MNEQQESVNKRIKKALTITMQEHGKLPPQCVDIEEVVLGGAMLESDAFKKVTTIIKADCFYKVVHQRIWSAMNDLYVERKPIDIITVTSQLRKNGDLEMVGGAYYITMLTSRVASSANIEYHATLIKQKYLQREIIRIGSELINEAYDDTTDVIDLIAQLNKESNLLNIQLGSGIEPTHISEITPLIINQIQKNVNNEVAITGIPTGLSKYDEFTGGLHNSDLIIIAGETSMGKTSLCLTMLFNSSDNYVFDIYSLEMSDIQLAARLHSQTSEISSKRLLYNHLEENEIQRFLNLSYRIDKKKIYINPVISTNGEYICNQIRANKSKLNTSCAVIDYLQLMTGKKGESPEQMVGNNSRMFKNLAKELNIPIILLSQLARDRQNPYPTLARLRQSGQIEESADIVVFIYRPEYYHKESFQFHGNTVHAPGVAEIVIAKGRNIGITEFLTTFDGRLTLFKDLVENDMPMRNFNDEPEVF